MWNMIWPIAVVVLANTVYNICPKSTPGGINSFAALFLTYVTAAAASLALFFVTAEQKNLVVELSKANWASWVLGAAIIGLEFGYIAIYRAGWKVSAGSLVANISLACVLLVVGTLLYHEHISVRQMIGVAICALGLYFVGK